MYSYVSVCIDSCYIFCVDSYYINGRTARVEDMMSRDVLDSLIEALTKLQDAVAAAGRASTPVWLGETSSCWGGGAPGLSDRYVAGFMWVFYVEYNNNNNNKQEVVAIRLDVPHSSQSAVHKL